MSAIRELLKQINDIVTKEAIRELGIFFINNSLNLDLFTMALSLYSFAYSMLSQMKSLLEEKGPDFQQ